jgi:hypothetical protein
MFVLHGQSSAPRTSVIGFPPAESHVAPVDPSNRTGSGALSFSGQGHAIWQDSPSSARSSAVVSRPQSESERAIFGESSSAIGRRPIAPHRVSPPFFGQSGFFYPYYAFAPFGFYGGGFCDPYWGFDPSFGCGGLGFGFGYGFGGYGYGYGYPGYFGGGYNSSYNVGSSINSTDYLTDGPADNYSNTFSPDPSAAQQGTDQPAQAAPPAPPTTVIYFKDGTSFDVMSYWLDAGKLHYITNYGGETSVDMNQLDLQRTVDENARAGVNFTLRPAAPAPAQAAPDTQATPQQ